MSDKAVFSPCKQYRYYLQRVLDRQSSLFAGEGKRMVICMLNPSTADEVKNDPTVRRCIGFAVREQVTMLEVLNLYALRSTDPAGLWAVEDPVGPENDHWIGETVKSADLVVVAWGTTPYVRVPGGRTRTKATLKVLGENSPVPVRCLGTTKDGYPRHPLYLPADTQLQIYSGP